MCCVLKRRHHCCSGRVELTVFTMTAEAEMFELIVDRQKQSVNVEVIQFQNTI